MRHARTTTPRARHARRTLARLGSLAVIAVSLAACHRDPDPISIDETAIAVHAILEAGLDSVVIAIRRANGQPITAAEVRLLDDDDDATTWLVERAGGPPCAELFTTPPTDWRGCYHGRPAEPIRPDATYRLEIDLPDGRTVVGQTRVGALPLIQEPEPSLRVTVSCDQPDSCYPRQSNQPPYVLPIGEFAVRWVPPEEAARIRITLAARNVYLDGVDHGPACFIGFLPPSGSQATAPPDGSDGLVWGIGGISCEGPLQPARFDSIRAALVVRAWNRHYADYLDAASSSGSVRAPAVTQGLEGAYGVFGAVSAAEREVVLVRE